MVEIKDDEKLTAALMPIREKLCKTLYEFAEEHGEIVVNHGVFDDRYDDEDIKARAGMASGLMSATAVLASVAAILMEKNEQIRDLLIKTLEEVFDNTPLEE
jgi:thymidine kinase